jgi:hypothetical protein
MRTLRVRLVIVLGAAVAPSLLAQCGGGGAPEGPPDAAHDAGLDAASQDARASDRSLPDGSTTDVSANADSEVVDAGTADAPGEGDAADAAEDTFMGIPCTPPSEDAGDAGDSGEGGDARDGQSEAGDAGDGGSSDSASGAGEAGAIGTCPGALTCCGGWCTNTAKDPRNCGSCGNACSSTQFCTGVVCDDAVVKNVCGNPVATVVDDPFSPDNTAGSVLGTALMSGCTPGVTVRTTSQDSGIAQDPASGRPLTGPGDTLVAGGGFFGQASVLYMEKNALVGVYAGSDATSSWIRSSQTNANIVSTATAALTTQHDYFVVEVGVEPVSGTLCLYGYGLMAPGTTAASYYFQNYVIGNRPMFPNAWYVYEWTDTDNDGVPSSGDTFSPIANGN